LEVNIYKPKQKKTVISLKTVVRTVITTAKINLLPGYFRLESSLYGTMHYCETVFKKYNNISIKVSLYQRIIFWYKYCGQIRNYCYKIIEILLAAASALEQLYKIYTFQQINAVRTGKNQKEAKPICFLCPGYYF
jgi:hypothetical protein